VGRLLEALPPGRVGFCFDTGHFNAFAQAPLDAWMDALGHRLFEVHLHDNQGALDEHLPVGDGNFPFNRLFDLLKERSLRPILTVEAHSERNLAKTLSNIKALGLLDGFADPCATGDRPLPAARSVPGRP